MDTSNFNRNPPLFEATIVLPPDVQIAWSALQPMMLSIDMDKDVIPTEELHYNDGRVLRLGIKHYGVMTAWFYNTDGESRLDPDGPAPRYIHVISDDANGLAPSDKRNVLFLFEQFVERLRASLGRLVSA